MTIIVLYNFKYKKLSKPCPQLLRYKQPVPYLTVNAGMDNTILKSGVFSMSAFTKSTSSQALEAFQTMYITRQIYQCLTNDDQCHFNVVCHLGTVYINRYVYRN